MRARIFPLAVLGLLTASCGNSILQYEFVSDKSSLKIYLPELYEPTWPFRGVMWNNDTMAYIGIITIPNLPDGTYADDVVGERLLDSGWKRVNRKDYEGRGRVRVTLLERNSLLIGHEWNEDWARKGFWPRYEEALKILRKDPSKDNPLDLPG